MKEIQTGKFDKEIMDAIKACVKTENRWGLLLIAYSLFSRISLNYKNDIPFTALKALLFDEFSQLKKCEPAFQKCLDELKGIDSQWILTEKMKKESSRTEGRYWSSQKVKKEDQVTFSHGGGFFFLLDILRGISKGYKLEGERGFGVQVHPRMPNEKIGDLILEREIHDYAKKGTGHFDFPVRLVGYAQAQFLEKAVNEYEAGIHASDFRKNVSFEFEFQKITNKDKKSQRGDDPLWGRIWNITDIELKDLFPNDLELQKCVAQSLRRLRPI